MNRPNLFSQNSFFKPAAQLLRTKSESLVNFATRSRSSSLDDSDNESGTKGGAFAMDQAPYQSGSYLAQPQASPIPLVDISRSPSPSFARSRSAAQSEDEDEDDLFEAAEVQQSRPLVSKQSSAAAAAAAAAKNVLRKGGLGQFFFGTAIGWRVYVGLLVFWVGGCQFGLLLMNRFIFWTGTYKFPYPLTTTLIQLLLSHVLVLALASSTRGLSRVLNKIGLGAVVAPSQAYTKGIRATRYTGGVRTKSVLSNLRTWFTHGSGGIAGGGLFEWQWASAKHVLPAAVVFTAKVVLSNLSYAYAVLPMYMLSRMAIIPLTLILTTILLRQQHSVQTLSSTLVATLNLLIATFRPGDRVTWESVVSGAFSSLFVALYPILLLRGYRQLVSDLVPQGDLLAAYTDSFSSSSSSSSSSPVNTGTKEETRAYWRTLHYISIMSIALLLPIVLLSGELHQILPNCYFLDVPWFWFLMLCASAASWAVFAATLLLLKATSPLTANFVAVPRSAFQLVVLSKFRMPAHSWVGVSLCAASCLWYLFARARDGRGKLGSTA